MGREAELAQLHGWLEKALSGERQMVFVTGEPGIGKTTLVEEFLQSLESRVQRVAFENQGSQLHNLQTLDPRRETLDAGLWIGRGQCVAHYGAGKPTCLCWRRWDGSGAQRGVSASSRSSVAMLRPG